MATVADIYGLAVQYLQAGNAQLAEQLYRQILQADPSHVDAWCFLGVACQAQGNLVDAEASLRQAVDLLPSHPSAESLLGGVLLMQSKPAEAVIRFQNALNNRPNNAQIQNNLGVAYAALGSAQEGQGRLKEAVESYRQAVGLRSEDAQIHYTLGALLAKLESLDEAIGHFRHALRLKPDFPEALVCLGNVVALQNRLGEAAAIYREALRVNPQCAEAFNGLGSVFERQDNLGEALHCCREALRLKPDFPEAVNNLGIVLMKQDKLKEAIGCFRQALSLNACCAPAYYHFGMALERQGKFTEAISCYDDAIRLQPMPQLTESRYDPASHSASAHWNRALLWLLLGDFEHGWPGYEWRWTQPGFTRPHVQKPIWDGSDLDGRRILLHCEQGLGDTMQFIRYIPFVKQRRGYVIVECNHPLMRLLTGFPGIDQLAAEGLPLPAFDIRAPLLSLPGIFHTSVDTIPAVVPYLHADRALTTHWRNEMAFLDGFKIGIAWQGNPAYRNDRLRSIPLTWFAPLAEVPNVQFISLQKGPGTDQLSALNGRFTVHDFGEQLDKAAGAFMDTAAIMKSLDLVICSDSAVAHLAGALGVPVWLVLPAVPDWRWMLDREDSPWYPTMRLFRQNEARDWDDVFKRIAVTLREYVKAPTPQESQRLAGD